MLESFNFDIIILLILISSIIAGLYFNLYRQGRRTLALILPFIILTFIFNFIFDTIRNIEFINNVIFNILGFFKIIHQETAYALIVYFLSFILLSLFVRIVYSLFRVPVQKRVLNKSTSTSRILGAIFGLFSGYVLGMLFMFILNPFIGLNYEKPITKIYTETSNNVLTFSSLNELMNVNEQKYEDAKEVLGELTGRNALTHYQEVIDIFYSFTDLEVEFTTTIIPSFTGGSAEVINSEDILRSFLVNSKTIMANEKANPNLKRLKEIEKYINKNTAYLQTYSSISDYEFTTLSNYLITNQDELISELTNDLYKDNLNDKIETIKRYLENKDEYLSLLDYVSVDIFQDVLKYEYELNTNTDIVIDSFNKKYTNPSLEHLINLNNLFTKYNKNKELIDMLNPHLSLSIKLTLSDRYSYYFVNDSILKNKLLRLYILDSITTPYVQGYKLYSEYVFYTKLVPGIDLDELSKDEFIVILNNLNKLVTDGIFSKDQAKIYFINLFTHNDRFFNLLNDDLIEEIKNIENEYLSEELYALLN